jgi:hypothetical protein
MGRLAYDLAASIHVQNAKRVLRTVACVLTPDEQDLLIRVLREPGASEAWAMVAKPPESRWLLRLAALMLSADELAHGKGIGDIDDAIAAAAGKVIIEDGLDGLPQGRELMMILKPC